MSKKRALTFVVIISMLLLLFSGVPVMADTVLQGVVVGQTPVVASQGPVSLATIGYAESGGTNFQTGDSISITLPANMELQAGLAPRNYYDATSNLSVAFTFSENNRTITYTFVRTSVFENAEFKAKLPVFVLGNIPTSGNVAVWVATNNSRIGGGVFNAGSYGSPTVDVNVSPESIPVLQQNGTNPQAISRTVIFTENGAGAFRSGSDNKIILTLKNDHYWGSPSYTVQTNPALPAGVTVTAVRLAPNQLYLVLNGGTTTAATTFSIINPSIHVESTDSVTVEVIGMGMNSSINKSLTLAKIAGSEVFINRQAGVNPFSVISGRQGQAMANIEIIKSGAGNLSSIGSVTLTLPSGMQFTSPPSATYNGMTGTQPIIQSNSENRTITMNIFNTSPDAGSIVLNFNSSGNIVVSPGFSGDVKVNVSGTAGISGSVVIANVVNPVMIKTLDVAEIPRDNPDMVAGAIEIEESAAGNISTGVIILQLPDDIAFTSLPSIFRSEGNISFGFGSLSNDGSTLTIPVNSRSTQASKIVIGNINYKIANRWWDRGSYSIDVSFQGNSLIDPLVSATFTSSADKLKVINAELGVVEKSSVFTIGSKRYTLGRETKEMDQEPVIVSGRTMLPLRFVGEAVGLSDEEVYWDAAKRTVTLFRGDRVAQVTIGSKTLLINGTSLEMDVAPEIMNSRTMLPIRWIGLALNVDVEWDASARTVTVTP